MVKLNVPVPVCDLPFRVHGKRMKYVVTYFDGSQYVAFGFLYSVRQTFDALVRRLNFDSKIDAVTMYCPDGTPLCCCYRV